MTGMAELGTDLLQCRLSAIIALPAIAPRTSALGRHFVGRSEHLLAHRQQNPSRISLG